jgi:hypothetical protein
MPRKLTKREYKTMARRVNKKNRRKIHKPPRARQATQVEKNEQVLKQVEAKLKSA